MDGLQRSDTSFRRTGSSGLVWNDKLFSGELNRIRPKDQKDDQEEGKKGETREHKYRTSNEVSPTMDPPSPRVSGCGLCAMFGKPKKTHKSKPAKRK